MARLAAVYPAIVRSFAPGKHFAQRSPRGAELGRVDFGSGVPRYLQVKRILAEAILQGVFPPGTKLPNTDALSAQLQVSLITAHRALLSLVGEGLVSRERGRGTFVRDKPALAAATSKRTRVSLVVHPANLACQPDLAALLDGICGVADDGAEMAVMLRRHCALDRGEFATSDGVIAVQPPVSELVHLEALARDLPVLLLASGPGETALPCVDAQNAEGIRSAVQHLVHLGHDRLALLSGSSNFTTHIQQREGFRETAREYGLAEADVVVLGSAGAEAACSAEAVSNLMRRRRRPTGLIAPSYGAALEALVVLRQIGLRVPDDVSMVGFDDPRCAALLDPPLTTVVRPLEAMARSARRRMLDLIDGRACPPQSELLPPLLMVRDSTAPPP